ncbi:hypothetical protein NC652_011108 [Populus alba x Populus x berolinensis]|nr:hypothetical protein NC652_011108 [Populus alba x Populus x berolinensis]
MSHGKSQKRTFKSYSFLLRLQIMKSYIKALSLYNPQNLSSPKKVDGIVEIIFKKGESSTSPPRIFSSSISMVQPVQAPLPVPVEFFL